MTTGEKIRSRRKALKMSGEELGRLIGKDKTTIYRYESSQIDSMPYSVLIPLAEALHCTPGYFLDDDAVTVDTAELAALIASREDLRQLMETAVKATPEQIQGLIAFMEGMLK